jgi:hypothetical protein
MSLELAKKLDALSAALYDLAMETSHGTPVPDTLTAISCLLAVECILYKEGTKWNRFEEFVTAIHSKDADELVRVDMLAKSLADVERYSIPVLVPPPGWTIPDVAVPDRDADMVHEEMKICIHEWDTPVPMSNGGQVYDCEKCGYREVRREIPTTITQTESDEDMETVFIPETPPRAPTKKRRMAIVEDTPDRLGSRLRPIVLPRAYKKHKCSKCSNGVRGCHCVWFL